ncbi:YegS/Rv2252/BmrU family lipid kinase [Flammeovirgaceae bacterium SG7u.111]|nr:YegS/Rv2252/BmrU family lipid kinase [Flammeovirgaceae bacterium SG7u.132]WPO33967.1 YegS/Rv2252/BmrU family lipid kinase [Flammeovirgaceae bacterium SG7u.111]
MLATIFVIINPHAGNGKALEAWEKTKSAFSGNTSIFSVHISQAQAELHNHVNEAYTKGIRRFLAVGGDGTLHSLINALAPFIINKNQETLQIGLLPTGTGNDWVKSQGIDKNIRHFTKILGSTKEKFQNICKISYTENDVEKERYFLNIASLGFGGKTVENVDKLRKKVFLGKLTFIAGLAFTLFGFKSTRCKVVIDGSEIKLPLFILAVGKGKFFGGGIKILPHAQPDDNQLAISMVSKIPKWKVLVNITRLFDGTYTKNKEVVVLKGKEVLLKSAKKIPLEIEGEFIGFTKKANISLTQNKIKVFVA